MQIKGTIKFLAVVFLLGALVGCERASQDHGMTDDVKVKNALKSVLVEARLSAFDNAARLNSTDELIALLESTGKLKPIAGYARTNIFFNPDVSLWSTSTFSNRLETTQHAIIVRRNGGDYASVTFDGRFAKHHRCPAEWCE